MKNMSSLSMTRGGLSLPSNKLTEIKEKEQRK